MYCSISVLASVVALNNVVASSGISAQAEKVMLVYGNTQQTNQNSKLNPVKYYKLRWCYAEGLKDLSSIHITRSHFSQHYYIVGRWGKRYADPLILLPVCFYYCLLSYPPC